MTSKHIQTWHERDGAGVDPHGTMSAMKAEIADLRAYIAELEAELGQVQANSDDISEHLAVMTKRATELRAALAAIQPVAPKELSNAFITLESAGGDARAIVLKFNHREDAYAVQDFLLKGGITRPTDAAAVPARKLEWSAPAEPNDEIAYNHVTAQTPFGRILITWKGWKDYPSFAIDDHPVDAAQFLFGNDLEDTKSEAEQQYFSAVDAALASSPAKKEGL